MHASTDPQSPQRPARESPLLGGHLSAPRARTPALPTASGRPGTRLGPRVQVPLGRPTRRKAHGPPALDGPAPGMPRGPSSSPRRPPPSPALPSLRRVDPQAAAARLHLRWPPRPLPLPQPGPAFESRREPGELRRWTGATPHLRLLLPPPPSPLPVLAGGVCGAGRSADSAALAQARPFRRTEFI